MDLIVLVLQVPYGHCFPKMTGMFIRAMAIMAPGIFLSPPPIISAPSMNWLETAVSIESTIISRDTSERGEIKLAGMANGFHGERVDQHLHIIVHTGRGAAAQEWREMRANGFIGATNTKTPTHGRIGRQFGSTSTT